MTWFIVQTIVIVIIGLILAVVAWFTRKHFHPWQDLPKK